VHRLGRRIDDLPEPALVAFRRQVPFVPQGSALLVASICCTT